jgi:hypothetical protein
MAFQDGFKKTADGPAIDPEKAKQMQAGAMQSGWQPKQWMANLKSGLGISTPPPVKNTGLMGGG